ncbi:MAG: ubiquinone/menaquinone biosynthesis methyltransferase [Syntrophaceae bacterium]|nr:ubiquinone/menaquinone biosynthesis methyltransferase [Syntrophaceae bacterium]
MTDDKSLHNFHRDSLNRIFGAIPGHYDLVNRLFTWGMDKSWRRQLVSAILKHHPKKILDIGCGTGDLSTSIALHSQGTIEITGYDFSEPMLEIATCNAQELVPNAKLTFIQGEAAQMPFPDEAFDCIGISFALRNLIFENPLAERHLSEIRRVLKTGGHFLCVESSQPRNRIIRALSHFYIRSYVYWIGVLISGDRDAYRYLAQSAINFYTPEEVGKKFLAAGFRQFFYRPLFFGAAGIYQALK